MQSGTVSDAIFLIICFIRYKPVAMKPAFFLGILSLLIWSCSPVRETARTSAVVAPNSQDSTEYELIIDDIHFEQWYLLNYSESKDRTDDYYHSKNLVAAYNWNDYYRGGKYIGIIDSYVNYEPQIDYGIELNRKLFWYFRFVQEYYKVKLYY
jgi:hypothetical protein